MKLELIENKTSQEIGDIWREYHKNKDCISGSLTPNQFDLIFQRGTAYPTFLLPLPHDHGYEFIVCQFEANKIHMTPLIWYQTHKENAPECLVLSFFNELRTSKDLILMRGQFDQNSINVQQAQFLANELQLYYGSHNSRRLELLETFTKKPIQFKHMELIKELKTLSL